MFGEYSECLTSVKKQVSSSISLKEAYLFIFSFGIVFLPGKPKCLFFFFSAERKKLSLWPPRGAKRSLFTCRNARKKVVTGGQ
jgi:hypothetical protein